MIALPGLLIEPLVRAALAEDLGRAGDVTSAACLPDGATARALLRARAAGVVSGLDAAAIAFRLVDPGLTITVEAGEGARVQAGQTLLVVEGRAAAILAAERTALNFAARLSGIATLTRLYADALAGTPARVAATRKTTPLLRALEKRAVVAGGGVAHRYGLDDAILIKDNHIAVAGGLAEALGRARAVAGHLLKIEVEVDRLDQLDELLAAGGADAILLDNMDTATLAEAVRRIAGRAIVEASGGITRDRLREVAATGVDLISTSAITQSAPALDLGLDIVPTARG
jgi:nicotinate-nucleotide pyrophosphorylase (carboxylating)